MIDIEKLIFPCFLQYERTNGKSGSMIIKDRNTLEEKLKRKDLFFPLLQK